MNPLGKILIGALMIIAGVYSTVTFWPQLLTVIKGGIGPLLAIIGAFIVWLESDEWKMRRAQKQEEAAQLMEQRTEQETQTDQMQQDVKEAVESGSEESEGHVCGECGREFDTQRGLSIHQAQKHD